MTKLVNVDNGKVLLDQLEIADTVWKRFKGLQFRRSMPTGSGLLLAPCSSLHTCFMRFPIDIIMLDSNDIVLAIRRGVQPWRIVLCVPDTAKVIETGVGCLIVEAGTEVKWLESCRRGGEA